MANKTADAMATGRLGEQYAAAYLCEKGYEILEMNAHAGHGELDVIARMGDRLVFVEVKTRHADRHSPQPFGTPADAVNGRKREMLVKTAEEYLRRHDELGACYPRIDVIEVYLDSEHRPSAIEHYENAVRKRNVRRKNQTIPY